LQEKKEILKEKKELLKEKAKAKVPSILKREPKEEKVDPTKNL